MPMVIDIEAHSECLKTNPYRTPFTMISGRARHLLVAIYSLYIPTHLDTWWMYRSEGIRMVTDPGTTHTTLLILATISMNDMTIPRPPSAQTQILWSHPNHQVIHPLCIHMLMPFRRPIPFQFKEARLISSLLPPRALSWVAYGP